MKRIMILCWLTFLLTCAAAQAQYKQAELPLTQLPADHDYQKKLRQFLAILTVKDFEVVHQEITPISTTDPEEQYRLWLLSQHPHAVSAAMLPPASFTLKEVEAAKGLVLPCAPLECQLLAWLANWNYPGNPYFKSRPLKLRAFVLAATDLMMLDYLYEHDPQGANRADFLGGNLIWLGYTYQAVKDALPPAVLASFETGLKKMVMTIDRWGPRGAMTDMDLFAPVGLRYIASAMNDPEVTKIADRYSRRLFTDPHFFHPAGYFVDNGCFDTSYNGISLYFGTWAALMSDWKFAQDAIGRAHRLRAHLSFPHPDGIFSGPSAMASRCSSDPPRDQWQFPPRMHAAGMVTEEGLYVAPLPTEDQLKAAPKVVVSQLNGHLAKLRAASPQPWRESHWSGFLNYAYEFYPKGYYQRRLKLVQEKDPLLKPLYLRQETFVRDFAKTFVIAQLGGFAAAIHTGPVAGVHQEWQRPYGFGGGQLCAFWTADTGPVLLTRRRGVQGHIFDTFAEWRTWPVHAVTGLTADGDIVTSTRIQRPDVEVETGKAMAHVRVTGILPKYQASKKQVIPTSWHYERTFDVDPKGVKIQTKVTSPKGEKLTELYETIPVFLRETASQKMPTIRFQIGQDWLDASAASHAKVKVVAIQRFSGEVQIIFTQPQTIRLAPDVWQDGFQTQAQCRTLLIDLLELRTNGQPLSVEYTITSSTEK
jgi:hypothetical protein